MDNLDLWMWEMNWFGTIEFSKNVELCMLLVSKTLYDEILIELFGCVFVCVIVKMLKHLTRNLNLERFVWDNK